MNSRWYRRWYQIFALCVVAAIGTGCGTLPANPPQLPTYALSPTTASELGRVVAASVHEPGTTGFRLLPQPEFSLDARIELTRRAQQSLDLQYYEFHDDKTGRYLLRLARDAAQRGVRVRLLLDDLNTSGEDRLLSAFASHNNVEVRLFNPFPHWRSTLYTRYAASLVDFNRLNRRMHNKMFIADGSLAVLGGRNIGDEYFRRDAGANFLDIDALVGGALLPRLGSLFDQYWNSPYAYPIDTIVQRDAARSDLQAWFERQTSPDNSPPPEPPMAMDILGHAPVGGELARGALSLTIAGADVFADSPDKVARPRTHAGAESQPELDSVLYNVRLQVRGARKEVIETTPYLVPGREGMESMRQLRARGVKFSIVTNSLASIDELAVYTGYRRYRPQMLRLGVDLFELSPNLVKNNTRSFGRYGLSIGRLHAKCAVIDGETIYIGSMNFDPRSDKYNTEFGVLIHSQDLASELVRLIDIVKSDGSYQVRMSSDNRGTEWTARDQTGERILIDEPESTNWKRLLLNLLTPFTPEDLL